MDSFTARWGEHNEKQNREIAQTYPEVGSIAGEYLAREITIK